MDTSKEYIEMCEKAQEIQIISKRYSQRQEFAEIIEIKTSLIKVGDSFTDNFANYWSVNSKFNLVWLPCQDQLQEMIDLTKYHLPTNETLLNVFRLFCTKTKSTPTKLIMRNRIQRLGSFEQLWLAFVMFENYQKHWDSISKEWFQHPQTS